jgi:polyvinyl alcohol dehydrogenase (cytochrome)
VHPENWQWQFRGSVVALNVRTGQIKWKTYTVPHGYYGGGVWGSTPAIDIENNRGIVTTGNNYAVPPNAIACLSRGDAPSVCINSENYADSVVAIDITTGKIEWGGRGLPSDVWNMACGLDIPGFFVIGRGFPGVTGNCPYPADPSKAGPDWDFAQGPMLLGGGLVGAGQKSGKFWAFDVRNGALKWSTQVAPGGVTGGLQWGSATDGKRIYVAASNSGDPNGSGPKPWRTPSGITTSGGWAALDKETGALLWTTADQWGSRSDGPVSASNGVVFGCNRLSVGKMVALSADTGQLLWSYDSGAPCSAGASISDGMVFWGSGTFSTRPDQMGPKKVFAFWLPSH